MPLRIPRLSGTLLGLAMACQTPPQDAAIGTPPAPIDLPLTRFRQEPFGFAQSSGYNAATQLVIQDQATWEQAWQVIHANRQPAPLVPAIDFAHETIALAALGRQNTGGYDIYIQSAAVEDSQVVLTVRQTTPGSTCVTTQALTQPVDIVRLPRRREPVHFVARPEVLDCR